MNHNKKLRASKVRLSALFLAFFFMAQTLPTSSFAGTFIGNGGSAQDLDLDATLAIINKTVENINDDQASLCGCPDDISNSDLCQILDRMSAPEKKACQEILLQNASALAQLSQRNSKIKFEWVDSPMSVKSDGNRERKVDAVTQVESQRIIINRKRFLEMPLVYRVALLSHELLHLVKISGSYPDDNAEIPPFKNGRVMLDTLGAAIAVRIPDGAEMEKIRKLEKVSRSKSKHWLNFDLLSVNRPKKSTRSLLLNGSGFGYSAFYSFRPDQLGLHLVTEETTNQHSAPGGIYVEENVNLLGLGVNYRINPFKYYLSTWNEAHLAFGLTVMRGRAKYQAESSGVTIKDSAQTQALKGSVKILMPAWSGFWFTIGADIRQLRYEYKALDIKIIENQSVFAIGGAYGL